MMHEGMKELLRNDVIIFCLYFTIYNFDLIHKNGSASRRVFSRSKGPLLHSMQSNVVISLTPTPQLYCSVCVCVALLTLFSTHFVNSVSRTTTRLRSLLYKGQPYIPDLWMNAIYVFFAFALDGIKLELPTEKH